MRRTREVPMVLTEPYFSLSDSRDTSCAIRFFSEPVPQLRDSWDNTWCYRQTETIPISTMQSLKSKRREEPVKSPWFSLNHISHLATVEIRVVRLGSFQNLYLSFAIVEITHGVTANRDDNGFPKSKTNPSEVQNTQTNSYRFFLPI